MRAARGRAGRPLDRPDGPKLARRALLGTALAVALFGAGAVLGAGAACAAGEPLRFAELYSGTGVLGLELSPRTRALAGREVTMRGYMAPPLKAEAAFFVLTRNSVDLCPFCDSDADWPADIVVVHPADDAAFLSNQVPIEVTGILEVGGRTDPASGFYSRLRLVRARFRALE